jgi:hypothetical protein
MPKHDKRCGASAACSGESIEWLRPKERGMVGCCFVAYCKKSISLSSTNAAVFVQHSCTKPKKNLGRVDIFFRLQKDKKCRRQPIKKALCAGVPNTKGR